MRGYSYAYAFFYPELTLADGHPELTPDDGQLIIFMDGFW